MAAELALARRWATATDIELKTALELRIQDTAVYRCGRLLITSARLNDVGLVG